MTAPLQIISISHYERTITYQTYTRESVAIVQQQRERLASSPFNDLQSTMARVVNEESYNAAQLCARSH